MQHARQRPEMHTILWLEKLKRKNFLKEPRENGSTIIITIIIIIIIIMKGLACFLFHNPQDEVGPSISSLVVLCSFVLLFDIVVFVLVYYLCPSPVRVVATFPGTVLFPLLCSVLPFSP